MIESLAPAGPLVLVPGAGRQALMGNPELVNDALITSIEHVLADSPKAARV